MIREKTIKRKGKPQCNNEEEEYNSQSKNQLLDPNTHKVLNDEGAEMYICSFSGWNVMLETDEEDVIEIREDLNNKTDKGAEITCDLTQQKLGKKNKHNKDQGKGEEDYHSGKKKSQSLITKFTVQRGAPEEGDPNEDNPEIGWR